MTTVNDNLASTFQPDTRRPDEKPSADEIRKAAREFEAYLLKQMFQQMQKAQDAIGGKKQMAADFHRDSFSNHVAKLAADQGGIGVAEVLEKAWLDHADIEPTEDALPYDEDLHASTDADAEPAYTAAELRVRLQS